MTNEAIVTYEQAVALKAAGFDWECGFYYTNGYLNDHPDDLSRCVRFHNGYMDNHNKVIGEFGQRFTAPALHEAQKWLREVKDVEVVVKPRYRSNRRIGYDWLIHDDCSGGYSLRSAAPLQDSYEGALSAGIHAALKLIGSFEAALKLIEEGEG